MHASEKETPLLGATLGKRRPTKQKKISSGMLEIACDVLNQILCAKLAHPTMIQTHWEGMINHKLPWNEQLSSITLLTRNKLICDKQKMMHMPSAKIWKQHAVQIVVTQNIYIYRYIYIYIYIYIFIYDFAFQFIILRHSYHLTIFYNTVKCK